ncbi:exodeoxyribonuclease VII large subunit [Sulfuriflexus mobilis]|uniref:exodeoxyribonuclease VII large subunit n=1 Tax=Sulfuriflexus mobilis TaxID=1811807 RepID=UPI000F83A1F9|nr:exodeoxyribonuclease VII large subunit [Sulfuriflexus mobilis]
MEDFADTAQREIFSVSELSHAARELLEDNFSLIWVEGEISNLAQPASGHIYFSLKDASSQLRCAMFRMRCRLLDFTPENGQQVRVRAKVSLYEARGDFQLIIEHMEEAGDGALRREYEAMKRRLRNEGLFEAAHKQPLPSIPRQIGVLTSPSGAAIRDILTVLKRRFPAIPVLIYPIPVQGQGAAEKIAQAIELANIRRECDVLLLSRGGGSLEDLWAFNEEVLARTIFQSRIPLVSAVGHEVDFTIADFVADVRAPTPSAAAELLSPDRQEWSARLVSLQRRLSASMQNRLRQTSQRLDWLSRRLQSPAQRLARAQTRIRELQQRQGMALQHYQHRRQDKLAALHARLLQHSPAQRVAILQGRQTNLQARLHKAMQERLRHTAQKLTSLGRALDAVSPLATLGRGYALAQRVSDGELLRDASKVAIGEQIETRLARGSLLCRVESSHNK